MRLNDLLENNAVTSIGDTEISSVTDDTRKEDAINFIINNIVKDFKQNK